MSSIPSGSSTTDNSAATAAGINAAFSKLGPGDFLKMMIAQLQNQSPLDPSDSSAMLQELNVMSQVSSTQTLNSTLGSVLLGQNLSNANGLIGATVSGLSDANKQITGVVQSVSIAGGTPKLNIGSDTMSLNNLVNIYPYGTQVPSSTGTSTGSTADTSGASGDTSGTSGTTGS